MRAARAELSWLSGRSGDAAAEAGSGYATARGHLDAWTSGALAIWLSRAGQSVDLPPGLPEPMAREAAGDWAGAAAAWDAAGPPV